MEKGIYVPHPNNKCKKECAGLQYCAACGGCQAEIIRKYLQRKKSDFTSGRKEMILQKKRMILHQREKKWFHICVNEQKWASPSKII